MKHSFVKLAIAACVVVTGLFTPVTAQSSLDVDSPKVLEAFVDGLVLPLMKNHNIPSGTIAIVKGGDVVFAKGYGHQNIAKNIPVDPAKTLFRPGSTSKLFTWVAVMQMVEQGNLDLDVDVNTYLKTFQIKDSYPGQPVTMRHIMTHTAGFEEGFVGYLIKDDPAEIISLAESMKRYQVERVNPPGAQSSYSNYATALAGLIVANISGIEFSEYIQREIFDALGMKSSSFKEPLPDYLNENMALAYAYESGTFEEKPFEIISNFGPAGAMSATATDMVKFAQAILNGGEYNGGRILKEATVSQMLTRNFSHDDRMAGIALGFYETEKNGLRFVGHGGDTQFFHSDLVIDQQNGLAYFVSFSGAGGRVPRSAFNNAFYDAFYPVEHTEVVPPSDFAARADKYAGNYLFWRSGFSKIEKPLMLVSGITVQPTEDNTLVVDLMGDVTRYAEIDKNLFQAVGGADKLAFQENADGEITGFVLDGMVFMSTFKTPFYYTGGFNFPLFGLSMLVFLGVILRMAYQRSGYQALSQDDKIVTRASIIVAAANLGTIILGAIVLMAVADDIFTYIPMLFKLWLIMPIIATLAGLYHAYTAVTVWKGDLLGSLWARIRYSIVTAGALFMCWFYYFWNILGFQYFS